MRFLLPLLLFPTLALAGTSAPSILNGSLTLEECIRTAVRQNLDLQLERIVTLDARDAIEEARAPFDPALSADIDYNKRRSPAAGSELDGADQPESSGATVTTGVSKTFAPGTEVSLSGTLYERAETNSSFARINPEYNNRFALEIRQPLLAGGGSTVTLAPLRLAGLAAERADLQTLAELNRVLRDTEDAYWDLVAAAARLEIRRQSRDLATLIVEETESRQSAELATRIDLLEARAALAESNEEVLVAQSAGRDAADALFQVMGILLGTRPGALSLEPLPRNAPFVPDATTVFARALETAPEARALDSQIRSRELDLAVARRNRLPRLDATLGTGALGRDGEFGGSYRRAAAADGFFWEAGIEVRVPWGLRAGRAGARRAAAALESARLDRQKADLALLADIRAACREIALADQQVSAATSTAELNRLRFEQRREERRAGLSTLRDTLEAEEEAEAAELRILEARVTRQKAAARLAALEGALPARYGIDVSKATAPEAYLQP